MLLYSGLGLLDLLGHFALSDESFLQLGRLLGFLQFRRLFLDRRRLRARNLMKTRLLNWFGRFREKGGQNTALKLLVVPGRKRAQGEDLLSVYFCLKEYTISCHGFLYVTFLRQASLWTNTVWLLTESVARLTKYTVPLTFPFTMRFPSRQQTDSVPRSTGTIIFGCLAGGWFESILGPLDIVQTSLFWAVSFMRVIT